jgi:hypothetical protein
MCKPGQIDAVAFTEPSPDGVLGVVELKGTKLYRGPTGLYLRCSLPIAVGPRWFVAPDGTRLAVPRGVADPVNSAGNGDPYGDLGLGKAAWGFGWFGSYCGLAPRYVVMRLQGKRGLLDVPYDGPTPACPTDPTAPVTSMLTDGPAGAPGSAVQPAPPSYVNLTTSAQFVRTATRTSPGAVEVTISDTATQPVTLTPCPIYALETADYTGKTFHFGSWSVDGSTPGCRTATVTVQPGQPVAFRVTSRQLSPGSHFDAAKGSTFTVEVDLAGMPPAKVSTTIK